jgi:hypothetical protein
MLCLRWIAVAYALRHRLRVLSRIAAAGGTQSAAGARSALNAVLL